MTTFIQNMHFCAEYFPKVDPIRFVQIMMTSLYLKENSCISEYSARASEYGIFIA